MRVLPGRCLMAGRSPGKIIERRDRSRPTYFGFFSDRERLATGSGSRASAFVCIYT
jgi:hypothetical protein